VSITKYAATLARAGAAWAGESRCEEPWAYAFKITLRRGSPSSHTRVRAIVFASDGSTVLEGATAAWGSDLFALEADAPSLPIPAYGDLDQGAILPGQVCTAPNGKNYRAVQDEVATAAATPPTTVDPDADDADGDAIWHYLNDADPVANTWSGSTPVTFLSVEAVQPTWPPAAFPFSPAVGDAWTLPLSSELVGTPILSQSDFERIVRHATHAHVIPVFEYL
jgi:hypothetical protein